MFAKPQAEHAWLEKLLGDWSVEGECSMGPDEPPCRHTGRATARSLGGLWVVIEGEGRDAEGDAGLSLMTLGYDPARGRYVGTFAASIMTHLWLYDGAVDAGGKKLVLDTEGPKFDGEGMAKYHDVVEVVDGDCWILSSEVLRDDGSWLHFMTARHRRVVELTTGDGGRNQ